LSGFGFDIKDAFVRFNSASAGASKLDWSTLTATGQRLAGVTKTLNVAVGAAIGLTVGPALAVGTFTLTSSSGLTLDDGAQSLTGDLLDLQLSAVSVFAGVGGSRSLATLTLAPDAIGLSVSGASARIEAFRVGAASYTGLALDVAAASLVGLSGFGFDIKDAFVRFNSASAGASKLDWSTLTATGQRLAGVTKTLNVAVGAAIGLTVGPALAVGTFTLTSSSGLTLDDGAQSLTGDLLDLQLSAVSVFAGVGGSRSLATLTLAPDAIGLSVSGASARIEAFRVGAASYTGLALDVAAASLVGLSGFGFDIKDAFVRFNSASAGASKLDWSTLTATGQRLAGVTKTLNVAVGAAIGLTVGPALAVGTFTLTSSSGLTLDDGAQSLTGDLLDLQLSAVSVFAGVGGSRSLATLTLAPDAIGLSLSGASARVEAFRVGAASYTGLALDVAAASLVGLSGFGFDIKDAFVRFNSASAGASKLDWSTLTATGQRLAGVTKTLNVAVGAAIGLTVGPALAVGTF